MTYRTPHQRYLRLLLGLVVFLVAMVGLVRTTDGRDATVTGCIQADGTLVGVQLADRGHVGGPVTAIDTGEVIGRLALRRTFGPDDRRSTGDETDRPFTVQMTRATPAEATWGHRAGESEWGWARFDLCTPTPETTAWIPTTTSTPTTSAETTTPTSAAPSTTTSTTTPTSSTTTTSSSSTSEAPTTTAPSESSSTTSVESTSPSSTIPTTSSSSPATTRPSRSSGELPATGPNDGLIGVGLALVLGGGALLVVRRIGFREAS